jgi:hypothetical protein
VKANPKIGFLLVAFLVAAGQVSAEVNYESPFEPEPETISEPSHRFSVSGKVTYHTLWKQGLLKNGAAFGRPGLGVSSLSGVGGEVEVDYPLKSFLVLSGTLGGYQGKTEQYKIDILTGYVLATVKIQKLTRLADYYVGAGLGAYFSRIKAEGTAYALKPGLHGLIGMRFHVTPKWSILLEDRLAFTMRAEEGFGDLDLGGNFVMLGGSRTF